MKKIFLFLLLAGAVAGNAQNGQSKQGRSAYFEKQIQAVQPGILSDAQKAAIGENYVRLGQNSSERAAVLFRQAVREAVADSLTLYKVFKKPVDKDAEANLPQLLAKYKKKFGLSASQADALTSVVRAQALETALFRYLHPQAGTGRPDAKDRLNQKYNTLLVSALTKMGVTTYLTPYCQAVAMRGKLNLSDAQADRFVESAWQIFGEARGREAGTPNNAGLRRIKKDKDYPVDKEQLVAAKSILDEAQFQKYLRAAAESKAAAETRKCWKKIVEAGLAPELDAEATKKQLKAYFIERVKIQEEYSIQPEKAGERDLKLAALAQTKPAVMAKLRKAKKRDAQKASQEANSLAW